MGVRVMIYFIMFTLISLVAIDVFYPFYSRKYIQFGISIPEPFVNEEQLARSRKAYSIITLVIHSLIIIVFLLTVKKATNETVVINFLVAMFIMGLISFTMYSIFHIKTKQLVINNRWYEKVTVVHVTRFDTKLNEKTFQPFLFIIPIIITLVVIAMTIQRYETIPDIIATHWGLDGKPDAWTNKSYATVIMLPVILLLLQIVNIGIAYGVSKASVQVTAQESEQSLEREVENRKQMNFFLAATNIALTILLLFLHVSTTLIKIENVTYFIMTFISYLIVISVCVFIYTRKMYKMKEKFISIKTDESIPADDHLWKWGLFYFNKDDPSILVEKRVGIGWTFNFARPGTYILLFVIVVLPLLPIFFL